mmetsp:Transcript_27873/g.81931  ORF Transcript_27873/g.81931 Transcript_27873/m.81931 type:complete len:330 (+) Transcript_27873:165-1154(+)
MLRQCRTTATALAVPLWPPLPEFLAPAAPPRVPCDELRRVEAPVHQFEELLEEEHGGGPVEHRGPVRLGERPHFEHVRQAGDVEDARVEAHLRQHAEAEVRVRPGRHAQQRLLLRDGREGSDALHHDEDGERHAARLGLGGGEVAEEAAGAGERGAPRDAGHVLEHAPRRLRARRRPLGLPVRARRPGHELLEAHAVLVHEGLNEGAHADHADVDAREGEAHHGESRDELLRVPPRLLLHDPLLRRVEAQGRGGRAVGDEVHPEQVQRREHLGQAHHRGEEDGDHLADVAGDEVVDEGLHVGVDGPALLHSRHDGGEVVVGEHHVRRLL